MNPYLLCYAHFFFSSTLLASLYRGTATAVATEIHVIKHIPPSCILVINNYGHCCCCCCTPAPNYWQKDSPHMLLSADKHVDCCCTPYTVLARGTWHAALYLPLYLTFLQLAKYTKCCLRLGCAKQLQYGSKVYCVL